MDVLSYLMWPDATPGQKLGLTELRVEVDGFASYFQSKSNQNQTKRWDFGADFHSYFSIPLNSLLQVSGHTLGHWATLPFLEGDLNLRLGGQESVNLGVGLQNIALIPHKDTGDLGKSFNWSDNNTWSFFLFKSLTGDTRVGAYVLFSSQSTQSVKYTIFNEVTTDIQTITTPQVYGIWLQSPWIIADLGLCQSQEFQTPTTYFYVWAKIPTWAFSLGYRSVQYQDPYNLSEEGLPQFSVRYQGGILSLWGQWQNDTQSSTSFNLTYEKFTLGLGLNVWSG
jgi:hypothetical protein